MSASPYRCLIGIAALLILPMLGIWLAGYPVADYLEFPPVNMYVDHAPFSPVAFAALAVIELFAIIMAVRAGMRGTGTLRSGSPRMFPWWGWAGVAVMVLCWIVAWSRFDWFAPFQLHTFTPIWLSYIVVVNALAFRAAGRCLLTHDTAYLLKLFPLSAAFWWFFEYLNRFVQNWTYEGVETLSPLGYFVFATASFSTVLPAVMSTNELLESWGVARRADDRVMRGPGAEVRVGLFIASFSSLIFLGVLPNVLFPLVWLAPLGLLLLFQPPEYFTKIFPTLGTWLRLSLAALVCGFFWELWNFHSLAKWVYHVPYVQAFHLFEMPILGYFGYLPFGWECAWLAGMIKRRSA